MLKSGNVNHEHIKQEWSHGPRRSLQLEIVVIKRNSKGEVINRRFIKRPWSLPLLESGMMMFADYGYMQSYDSKLDPYVS